MTFGEALIDSNIQLEKQKRKQAEALRKREKFLRKRAEASQKKAESEFLEAKKQFIYNGFKNNKSEEDIKKNFIDIFGPDAKLEEMITEVKQNL